MEPISARESQATNSPSSKTFSACSTRRGPPPPPIFTPKRNNPIHDRTSVGSSTSASTSSTSSTRDTLLLVSPTTPTKGGWYDDRSSLVFEYLALPTEGSDEWDASTPTHGKFRQENESFGDYGMNEKGNTKSWWAGVRLALDCP